MKLLAFDTCLDKTYVTICNGSDFIDKVILSTNENYHSAYLISTIVEILKSANITLNEIDYIATDIGPGSFTGIRACTTVARVLAQQLNIGIVGISSLEILSQITGEKNSMVVLDARRNKAYVYDNEILGAIELDEVNKLVTGKNVVTDNSLYEKILPFCNSLISYQKDNFPIGNILAKTAVKKINLVDTDWKKLKPLYIQPPPIYK